MSIRQFSAILFLAGLGFMLFGLGSQILPLGQNVAGVGGLIAERAPQEVGTANIVSGILLAYRGLDTLGELSILFIAATALGLVLGQKPATPLPHAKSEALAPASPILQIAAQLLFPLLLMLGAYIILYGHVTPGGGFQGGVILASAFFVPLLASPQSPLDERTASLIEGLAGISFILIGLVGLMEHDAFLAPLFGTGNPGELFSAGSLPLLYLAIGLKVGAELASLIARFIED